MKKVTTLVLAAALASAAHAPASAVEVSVEGEYQFQFSTDSDGFLGQNIETVMQKMALGLDMAVSEDLTGYFAFESEDVWGSAHNAIAEIAVTQAYIDWKVPQTDIKVRMGRQAFELPAFASASPVMLDLETGGIAVDVPFGDDLGLAGFWARGAHAGEDGDVTDPKYDVFGLAGTAKFAGLSLSPWAVFAVRGEGAGDLEQGNLSSDAAAKLWIAGAGFEWNAFDPFTLAFDAAYGNAAFDGSDSDQKGWYAAAKASYKLGFAEPALLAWYASGDDKGDPMHSGNLPTIYGDFDGTSTYFDGAYGLAGGHRTSIGGTWGIGAQLNGFSFVEGLSHDLSVTYFAGTNDKANGGYGDGYDYLTTADSAVEFNLLSTYEIYKNLEAAVELSYVMQDFDTAASHGRSGSYEDDWRMALHFTYTF